MEVRIYGDGNKGPEFWKLMGYFFASRKVRREMPYLIDDDGYTWFVAVEGKTVVGFSSCHTDKSKTGHLHGIYVVDEHRRKGIASRLVHERLDWMRAHGVSKFKAVASPKSHTVLLRAGFAEIGNKGKYIVMTLEDNDG